MARDMQRTFRNLLSLAAAVSSLSFTVLRADEPKPILLPQPQTDGGKPLMQALKERRTVREFKSDKLPAQVLSDVLWAGFGVNRPGTGYRTAPSAMNSQEVDIYVALPEGLYRYEAKPHRLQPVSGEDVRARTTGQAELKGAPVVLIFVADLSRLSKAKPEARQFYAAFDVGCISENIYLCCVSAGLATVVHELDRAPLTAALKLKPEQQIILAQAVGYPREAKSPPH